MQARRKIRKVQVLSRGMPKAPEWLTGWQIKKGTEEMLIGMAKHQGKGIYSTTNSYTDSLLEVDWDDVWWHDNQGSQVVKQGR